LVVQYFIVFKDLLIEVLPFLAIGFLLSGLIHEFVPLQWVERRLGEGGIKPILYSTIVGTILPICCFGSLPVAVSLRQKGARLGPVLAFLVATPATSITALLVTYGFLGLKFTVFIFLAVIVMGLVMGFVGNKVEGKAKVLVPPVQQALDPVCGMNVEVGKAAKTEYGGETYYFCCSHCQQAFEDSPEEYMGAYSRNIAHRVKHVFRYAFVDMVKEIGPELLLGLALAALVICSTASVPLVHAFVSQGMNIGAGMLLLLVGPITSWGTMLVLRKEFGGKILAIYLAVVCVMSLALGYCFSLI